MCNDTLRKKMELNVNGIKTLMTVRIIYRIHSLRDGRFRDRAYLSPYRVAINYKRRTIYERTNSWYAFFTSRNYNDDWMTCILYLMVNVSWFIHSFIYLPLQ